MTATNAKSGTVHVHSWAQLQQFGINTLTGEACAFSQRLLCDVNYEGRQLLSEFFGVPELTLARPMNSSVYSEPSVGSIMLARESWKQIARFALFNTGALGYYESDAGELCGFYDKESLKQYVDAGYEVRQNYALSPVAGPHVGSRNVHQMTGRVV